MKKRSKKEGRGEGGDKISNDGKTQRSHRNKGMPRQNSHESKDSNTIDQSSMRNGGGNGQLKNQLNLDVIEEDDKKEN